VVRLKGVAHKISIPSILEVGKNNINNIGDLIKKAAFQKVSIYFGEGIYELFGENIIKSIKKVNIEVSKIETVTTLDFEEIGVKSFEISNDVDALIGIGGGKAIDAVKYMSFLTKLPFVSIPTST
jgi:glycerol-1-phosphate dehydrogenase [NAD(P)+]